MSNIYSVTISVHDIKNKCWHLESERFIQVPEALSKNSLKPKIIYDYDKNKLVSKMYIRNIKCLGQN